MKIKNILFVLLGIFFIVIAVISAYNFSILYESEWVCLAQECVEYATGEEWVSQNCNPEGENNEMICKFYIPKIAQNVSVPLSGVNISNMVSCKKYECSSSALVSYSREVNSGG